MTVVADASVLIGLSAIGQLPLLHARFPSGIFIPEAVWREVVDEGRGRPGAQEVADADWITVRSAAARGMVQLLLADLEQGEAEAIALAHETDADIILLDERDARRAARRLGLRPLGTIGILIWAKQSGRVSNLREVLDKLQAEGNFRMSQTLYERALREVGEGEQ